MVITLFTIWLLHAAALVTPGANVLYVTYIAASRDAITAVYASIGIAIGAAFWSTSAILGVQGLFIAFPNIRLLIQIIGVIYLLYIAIRLWRTKTTVTTIETTPYSKTNAILRGLLVNLTNPKSALFFGSVFSVSLPANPSVMLLISAVSVLVTNSLCWHIFLAYAFSNQKVQLGYSRYNRTVNRMASALFGGLGILLLISSIREARN